MWTRFILYSPLKFVHIIIWKIITIKQMSENDEIETAVQKGAEQNSEPTARINIDDINKRNAEERKQEKRSIYIVAGIVLALIIVAAIYLFAK